MHTVNSFQRGAARSGIALIAVAVADVAEISASRALQNVSAEGGHVSKLLAGGEPERVGDHRIVVLNLGVGRDIRHSRQRAQPQIAAVEIDRGPCARERIDVDHGAWPHHVELHQIDQRGAAGKRLDFGFGQRIVVGRSDGQRRDRGRSIRCPLICERSHAS